MECRDERTRRKKAERYEERLCEICGKAFLAAKFVRRGKPNPAKLCSMGCVGENNRRLKLATRITKTCENAGCGKEFVCQRSSDQRFCSKRCAFVEKRAKCLHAPRAHLFIVETQGKTIRVRSRWEAAFIKNFLEVKNLRFQYETKTIVLDDGKTHYTPDFYLEDDDVFVEIKGFHRSNVWKASAARKMGFRVILADKNTLRNVYGLDMRESVLQTTCRKA